MKPGYKTTEFAVTIATLLGSLLSAVSGGLSAPDAAKVSGVLGSVYIVGRVIVKVAEAFGKTAGVDPGP
jgi:3-keto-L-gulonate-6-phosphate decarboxylase